MNNKKICIAALIAVCACQNIQTEKNGSGLSPEVALGHDWMDRENTARLTLLLDTVTKNRYDKKNPLNGYIYLSNLNNYERDIRINNGTNNFTRGFYVSAQNGAKLFWKLLTEKTKLTATELQDVIDLSNFFLYTGLTKNGQNLELNNLAFSIQTSQKCTERLDVFFRSYANVANNAPQMFQASSHEPWYSIHLRKEKDQVYRDLWLGYPQFKSFGITRLLGDALTIRPHNYKQGRPSNYTDKTNILTLDLDDLISTYLLLTHADSTGTVPTKTVVMAAMQAFIEGQNAPVKKPTEKKPYDPDKAFLEEEEPIRELNTPLKELYAPNPQLYTAVKNLGKNLITTLKQSKAEENRTILIPYFERLMKKYPKK